MSDRLPDGKFAPGASIGAATRFKPGKSYNPGGVSKSRRELVGLARDSMPKALARARQMLDDDNAEWRAWMEAGKFVLSCSALNPTAAAKGSDDDAPQADVLDQLSVEEVRALARQSLTEDVAEDDADDSDETEH